MPEDESDKGPIAGKRHFATTHWSIVVAAGGTSREDAQDALSQLCEVYWYPLYAYVRRRGYSAPDAQDLTQAFFARLLEKQSLRVADAERGKFRSFLLASLDHFLANERDRARAQKRGGGLALLSLDLAAGESWQSGAVARVDAGAALRATMGADATGIGGAPDGSRI
jgi:DNA-directed RNA polymerase specialized sigma24 family protein